MSLPDTRTATSLPAQPAEPMPAARPRAAFTAAAVTAIVAAAALPWDRPGIGWPLTALVAAAAVHVAVRDSRRGTGARRPWSRRTLVRGGWAIAVGLLLTVGAVR